MASQEYNYGYKSGKQFAEYHFNMWQDREGPPFPWPGTASGIKDFVEECLPRMTHAFMARIAEDAREAGVPADAIPYLPIPRELLKGVEDGYRERLTELVKGLVMRRGIRGY